MMNTLPYKSGIDALVALSLHDKRVREERARKEAEERMRQRNERILSLREILVDVCQTLGEPVEMVASTDRHAQYVRCRHLYYYVAKLKTDYTDKQIGAIINDADHTSVIHGKRKIKDQLRVGDESLMAYWRFYLHNSKLFTPEDFI